MSDPDVGTICIICGRTGAVDLEPPRRTFARGADPADSSYSIIAVLPNIALCDEHAGDVRNHDVSVGWCDDEACRLYGELGDDSPCGKPYKELRR
jgi:hypothetical protein